MGLHRNAELQISGTKVPQMKHNLRQEKLYSTVTLYSNQPTHGLHRNAEFTYQAFRTPKVNLSGISLKRETNQNFITFQNYGNWVTVRSDSFATNSSWLMHDMWWVILFNKIVQIASKPKCFKGIFIFISTNILGQSNSLIDQIFLY